MMGVYRQSRLPGPIRYSRVTWHKSCRRFEGVVSAAKGGGGTVEVIAKGTRGLRIGIRNIRIGIRDLRILRAVRGKGV